MKNKDEKNGFVVVKFTARRKLKDRVVLTSFALISEEAVHLTLG